MRQIDMPFCKSKTHHEHETDRFTELMNAAFTAVSYKMQLESSIGLQRAQFDDCHSL